MKPVLRGKFIAMNANIQKTQWPQRNSKMMCLKALHTQEQVKPQTSEMKQVIKISAEGNYQD